MACLTLDSGTGTFGGVILSAIKICIALTTKAPQQTICRQHRIFNDEWDDATTLAERDQSKLPLSRGTARLCNPALGYRTNIIPLAYCRSALIKTSFGGG